MQEQVPLATPLMQLLQLHPVQFELKVPPLAHTKGQWLQLLPVHPVPEGQVQMQLELLIIPLTHVLMQVLQSGPDQTVGELQVHPLHVVLSVVVPLPKHLTAAWPVLLQTVQSLYVIPNI